MVVSNEDIARRFVVECRRTRTVLPATSTIERICATALVDAERRIETRNASRLSMPIREQLLALLEDTADDRVTRFMWLRQFEPGSNSSSANRQLDVSFVDATGTTMWSYAVRRPIILHRMDKQDRFAFQAQHKVADF